MCVSLPPRMVSAKPIETRFFREFRLSVLDGRRFLHVVVATQYGPLIRYGKDIREKNPLENPYVVTRVGEGVTVLYRGYDGTFLPFDKQAPKVYDTFLEARRDTRAAELATGLEWRTTVAPESVLARGFKWTDGFAGIWRAAHRDCEWPRLGWRMIGSLVTFLASPAGGALVGAVQNLLEQRREDRKEAARIVHERDMARDAHSAEMYSRAVQAAQIKPLRYVYVKRQTRLKWLFCGPPLETALRIERDKLSQTPRERASEFPSFTILNGTNEDDLGDYRPGLKAAEESSIRSPLAECGIGKQGIRALAKRFSLPNFDKPASPCLSSRIPYGQPVTREKLLQIENAEKALNECGLSNVRVRHFGDQAKIEVPKESLEQLQELLPQVKSQFCELGFKDTVVDTEGLVPGKLNRAVIGNG